MFEAIQSWDLSVLHWIVEHVQCGFLDAVMPVITLFGEHGIFWMALTAILMIVPKTRKIGFSMALALALGFALGNGAIKHLVDRIRPYALDPSLRSAVLDAHPLASFPGDSSFPSGHTLASFECAVALFIRNRKWGVPALVLAVLIALSRLYLTVHFPTDVLAGAVLGSAIAVLSCMIVDFVYKKIGARKAAKTGKTE